MKRFSKLKTKKGFTLLETLLATCILVIIGSMLMEGFITAMGYSYNSSVYSRSAAYNGQLCIQQMADWSAKADGISSMDTDGSQNQESNPYKAIGQWVINNSQYESSKRTLSFGGGLGTINIAVYEKKNVETGDGNLTSFTAEKIKNNANAVADNRAMLFYYPTFLGRNPTTDKYFGNYHMYIKDGTEYWWGYDKDGNADDPVLVQQRVKTQTPKA